MAEMFLRIGGDNSGLRTAFAEAEVAAAKFGENVGKKFQGAAVATSVMSAAGFTLAGVMTKAADSIARAWTGMSEEEEAAFKSLEGLNDRAAALQKANARERLTDEQKYTEALQERDKLQRQVDAGASASGQDQVRLAKLKVALQEQIAAVIAFEKKERAEIVKLEEDGVKTWEAFIKARVQANEKEFQAQLATLSTGERIVALKTNIAAQERVIATGVAGRVADEEHGVVLAERKNQLIQLQATLSRELDREADQAFRRGQEEMREKLSEDQKEADRKKELAILLLKGEENLNEVEKEQLKILRYETSEYKQQAEIALLLHKGVANLTQAERDRLRVLVGQTQEIERQKDAVEALKISIKTINGRGDEDMSDRELAEKSQNLKGAINEARRNDPSGRYGFLVQQQVGDLERVTAEQQLRAQFRGQYASLGERALNLHSAFQEEQLRSYIRPADEARAQKTVEALIELNLRLENNGLKLHGGFG